MAFATIMAGTLAGLAVLTPAVATPDGQWYLDSLHIRQAQEISTGRGVTVAVIDSGIDKTRPALEGQVVEGKCFGGAEGTDPTLDFVGHGTAMAGLIAGNGKDRRHILGLAPRAKLMPLCVNVRNTTDNSTFVDVSPAIRYAADHGADIISMSLGALEKHAGDDAVARLHSAVSYAEDKDVVLVAAAGNKGQIETTPSPARLAGVVAVTGSNENGSLWKKSIPSKDVVLTAPAEHLLTTNTGTVDDSEHGPHDTSGYQITGGTSAATALVAGTAALVRSKYPKLDAANVINRLIKTADHQGSPGRNPQYGYGIVDPVEALTADVAPVKANPLGQLESRSAKSSPSDQPGATAEDDEGGNAGWVIAGIGILIALAIAASIAYRSRRTRSAKAEAGGWQPGGQPTARTPPPSPPAPRQQQPPTGATPPTSRGTPPAGGATPPTSRATPPIGGAAPSVGGQDPPDKYEIHWRKP